MPPGLRCCGVQLFSLFRCRNDAFACNYITLELHSIGIYARFECRVHALDSFLVIFRLASMVDVGNGIGRKRPADVDDDSKAFMDENQHRMHSMAGE